MADSLRDRLDAVIETQPEEMRMLARKDLEWLEARTELTAASLVRLISDSAAEPKARAIGAWIIGLLGERKLIPVLEEVARSGPPNEVLWEIVKALCELNHGGAIFRELLSASSDSPTRLAAVYALGRLRERTALDDLCRIVGDLEEPPALRGQATEALGYLADSRSLPSLLHAARDQAPEVRFWAAFALGQIGGSAAEAILEEMTRNDHAYVEGWWEISKEAATALKSIRSFED